MSSLQSLREFISERLAAAAEEIFRHCEGTIVQYEEELCRQRRLLDIIGKPQLQLHPIVLPQHYMSEKEDLCNQQTYFREEQEEQGSPQTKKEPEPTQVKEEQEELCINQDEEQLDLKKHTDTLMETFTYEEDEHREADLNSQQRLNETDSQSEEESQHEESTSTTDEEKKNSTDFFYTRTESGKRLVCEECGKSFRYMSRLIIHMRIHRGDKPFSCEQCDQSFYEKCQLKRHMRTHTGEKPFSCMDCDLSFSRLSNLKTHMRTHTGNKPFSCKECDTSFSRLSNLKRHMTTHM